MKYFHIVAGVFRSKWESQKEGARIMATRKCPKQNVSGKYDSQESKYFSLTTG